ncbi:MAG: DUF998 domain-containing protein [Euryarchaeota archaeon]|nr:DUF998 domain-containing protein [Euryarchaeota archaeon]
MNYSDRSKAGPLFALCSAQFFVLLMIAARMAPNYSMKENAISDLGTIGETAWLFNSSFVAVGLLTIA